MTKPTTVLITGGAGFIGSHTCVELLGHGYEVVVVDDYSNSSPRALDEVQKLAGRPLTAYQADLRDRGALDAVFAAHPIDAVIHFAAKKAVGESMRIPLDYFDINIGGTTSLLRTMRAHGVHKLVFSSSCTVYGSSDATLLGEDEPTAPTSPYARSKWVCEQLLADTCDRYSEFSAVSLRYFNPVGAHPSGRIGEDPRGVPNNVMPYMTQVAVGRLERLSVFGSDYPTPDGTAIRDYIHVVDVADGHRLAAERLDDAPGLRVFNLGTGVGASVLELVEAFSQACGKTLPYELTDRRPGDAIRAVADASKVAREWGWQPKYDLAAMCRDAWRFQTLNPAGYDRAAGPTNDSARTAQEV
ncbi:UDP-glucose 4-epimerase GalE [Actinospica sp.]|jgi:UDP-glucose 4-epimerase|uniref:UDP-glucose 4-epimerase GalE n=1 Tax=Actinospica sp. TaxID=1872142 RepID=UPI002BCD796C|nr:UDP-glucose 4-epimerase GalE [Actinospica sp.]HWG25081.1 UDP-glucose 4-epimerase GalE [Actinospica sp.]